MPRIAVEKLSGVWSATPTPFTDRMEVDTGSVGRMIEHHLRLGVKGLFLAGSCGEGAWMTDHQRRQLVHSAFRFSCGRLVLAVQVTDNSAARIVDNARAAARDGADIAVIAPPFFLMNAVPQNILNVYLEAIRESPLPVGVYDRGTHSSVLVPNDILARIYAEKNVVLVKDSSQDPVRMQIAVDARRKRPALRLLNGDEFDCVRYLRAGYNGLLLGGGIFNGWLANRIMDAVASGDIALAERLQKRMSRIMHAVYGGRKNACWLAGLKRLLVKMGIFRTWRNYLGYRLTPACEKAITRILKTDRDVLLPWETRGRLLRPLKVDRPS